MRTLVPAVLFASLAGSALGQVHMPDAYRYSIPDFDQRRQGLANSGNNHCVPTSHANLLAYIATHGFPLVFPNVTAPASAADYQDVTNNIFQMGVDMNTSGTTGTTGGGCQTGMNTWLGPFIFLFSINYQSGPDVTPADLYWDTMAGGLDAFCYGRWEFIAANGRYERTGGGHCISLKGVENYWFPNFPAGQYPTVAYRDPAADEGNVAGRLTMQSPFATAKLQVRPYVNNFKGYGISQFWELQTTAGDQYRRMMDGLTSIFPIFTLTPEPTGIKLKTPISILDSQQTMTLPLTDVVDLGFALKPTDVFVITSPPTGAAATLHRGNVPSGHISHWLQLAGPGGILAPGRRGEVYVFNTRQLRCLKPTLNGAFIDDATPVTILDTVDTMIYDDLRDGPTLLMGDGSVREYPRHLDGAPTSRSLSVNLVFSSLLHRMVPGANPSEYWFGPLTGNKVVKYGLATDGSGRLVPQDTCQPPTGLAIADFSVGDAYHLFLGRGGAMEEWYKPAAGGWALFPGSSFTGLPISGPFHVSRSRTDYDPAIHNTPDWNTEIDALGGEVAGVGESTLDCIADVGRQGGVAEPDGHNDNNDFIVFIDYFFANNPRADVGVQGGLPGSDGLFDNNDFVVFINYFFTCG